MAENIETQRWKVIEMELMQQITVENKQILCQAQIQSLEILSLDAVELEEFLQNEYMDNPMLEYTPNHEIKNNTADNFSNWNESQNFGWDSKKNWDDDDDGRPDIKAPDTDYLKNYITSQLDIGKFSKEEYQLILYLIDCLEDDGFFKMDILEVAKLTGRSKSQVEKILGILQSLEPFGIFAPNLSQCLIRQLEAMGIQNPTLYKMISDYLPEVGDGKISVISRKLGLSTAEVRKNIALIGKLNPRPLSELSEPVVSYIVPDIIYDRKNGEWEITINDRWFGQYHINDYYFRMMKESKDPMLSEYFKQKLERSRFVLNSLEQRRETMHSIAKAILEEQREYFEGTGKLKPMTMCTLAKKLSIHPSTVSRAVKGKYLQSPTGTILLKKLFCTTSYSCEGKESLSANRIKERLKELVESEDKKKPWSDAKLAELLAEDGIVISRRAVAKYRDELWIKSSFDRKERV